MTMNITDKILKAEEEKKCGNQFFKEGKLKPAIKKYHFSLLYLKDVDKPSPLDKLSGAVSKKISDEDVFLVNSLRGICYNNLAACLLKNNDYEKVIQYTTKTLEVDPNNIKALFRRGQAYLNTKDIENAEKDFLEIKDIDNAEKCVDKFFPVIEAERKRQINKEKDLYKKMLDCGKT